MANQSKWNIQQAVNKINQDITDKLTLAGEQVRTAAKRVIVEEGAVKTGKLLGSIDYEVITKDKLVRIGTNVVYAPFVELGTKYIRPRWFLTRGLAESVAKIISIFNKQAKI